MVSLINSSSCSGLRSRSSASLSQSGNGSSTLVELVALWIDPELDETAEVACCLIFFITQYFLARDAVTGIDQG